MSTKSKKLLAKLVGDDGLEKLNKAIFRRGTDNVADPLELYLPLLVVPRTILSWLVKNIQPLKVGQYKEFKFPGRDDITMNIEKQNTDTYRGEWVKDGRILHVFEKQTLPSIAGAMMTVGEVYDHLIEPDESDVPDKPKTEAPKPDDMVQAIMDENEIYEDLPEDAEKVKWLTSQSNVKELTGIIGKLVDALIDNKASRDDFSEAVDDMDKKEMPGDSQKVEENKMPELKGPKPEEKKSVAPECKEVKVDEGVIRKDAMPEAKAEAPGGAAMPKQPKMPIVATKPKMPSNTMNNMAAKQTQQSATGKAPSGTKAAPKAPTAPSMPKSPAMTPKAPTLKVEERPTKEVYFKKMLDKSQVQKSENPKLVHSPSPAGQAKMSSQLAFLYRSWTPAMHLKAADDHAKQAVGPEAVKSGMSSDHLSSEKMHRKLAAEKSKSQVQKSEKAIVTSEELHNPCPHCGKAEFKKSEDGTQVFSPCACFQVEQESATPFVQVKKHENGPYELEFSPTADPDSIRAFLLTLKARLMISKKLNNRE